MSRKTIVTGVIVLLVAVGLGIWLGLFPPWRGAPAELSVGAIMPLSGGTARYGENARLALELAVEEINAAGGIKGAPIQIIHEDSQAQPELGVAAIRKLIAADVPAIIGAMSSPVTLEIAPIAEENGVVLISPSASTPGISTAGDHVFRTAPSDTYEGAEMAQVAREKLGLARISIFYINNDYGLGLRDVFKEKFERLGGRIVSMEVFEQDATDFTVQLSNLKEAAPEAIYLVGHQEMADILKQAAELDLEAQLLSTVMFDNPELVERAGQAAEGVIFTTWALDPESRSEAAQKFIENYRDKYGSDPGIFGAEAYDALKLVARAAREYGYNADGIKKGLYEVEQYPGASGTLSFDANGDVIKPLSLKKVENGQFVFLRLDGAE